MTKIFLIRHAEAEGNIFRRAHGQFNGLIIGRGFAQIEQLKERFLHEKIDAVYSSDLSRTKATAAAISETHGLNINETKDLREVGIGEWEDAAWGDLNYKYPKMAEYFGHDPVRWNTAGSEEYSHVQERMRNCLGDIGRRHDGGSVAVFSHGFAIRALLCKLKGVPSHKTDLIPYCDNTAVTLLRVDNEEFTIEYEGDNSHLKNDMSTFAKQTWWRDRKERKSEDLRYEPYNDSFAEELYGPHYLDGYPSQVADIKLTAFLDDMPAGMLGLDTGRESNDNIGWISQIYIRPELRRMYYGVQLLGQAVSVYRKLCRESVRLETAVDSPAMSFCANYGFSKINESGELCVMGKKIRNW